jgi:MSHA biogenesis protein MshP
VNYRQRADRGFAAIAAIFLVVVLAALGGFMLTFSNTQQLTAAQDLQGSRAYWAARAGLEWAIAGMVATAPVAPALTPAATCPVGAAPTLVDGFALSIGCDKQTYTEAGATVNIFRFTSVAHSSGASVGSVGYIERSVSASVEQ